MEVKLEVLVAMSARFNCAVYAKHERFHCVDAWMV